MNLIATAGRLNSMLAALLSEWAKPQQKMELLRQSQDAAEKYHVWYYYQQPDTQFLGHKTMKSPADMWNYQEIIHDLGARLVVEFGTLYGGSALYFHSVLSAMPGQHKVLTVDIDHSRVPRTLKHHRGIEFLTRSSVDPSVARRIRELRETYPGPVFFILDSDHSARHVLAELNLLRNVTIPGDYVVVEDSNINGHPVLPGWGPGPFEAVNSYFEAFPNDYRRDTKREKKFGFTYATNGFLIRR